MVCLGLPHIPDLSIPSPFSLPPLAAGIALGGVGLGFCCVFHYQPPPLGISIPLPAASLAAAIVALHNAIKVINAAIDVVQIPSCPLD